MFDRKYIPATPMMLDGEIEVMDRLLGRLKPKRVLEFGSGGSTIYWPKKFRFIEEWVSIEHSLKWFLKIREEILPSVTLVGKCFPGYYMSITPEKYGKFDLILVDGSNEVGDFVNLREKMIEQSTTLLVDGGITILHDIRRGKYNHCWKYYSTFKIIHFGTEGRGCGLVLFKDPIIGEIK